MKKIIFICFVSFLACKKPSTPTPPKTPTPTPAVAKFIPNWWDNDTLYGMEIDANNQATGKYDTIITKTVNDTSFVIYRGNQYYIFREPMSSTDTFKNDELQYSNVRISPDKTEANSITKSPLNGAAPYKYKDQHGNWSYQYQAIMVNDYKNFKKVNMGYYVSRTKHK